MKNCGQFEEELLALASGEREQEECAAAARHIAECAACGERLAMERSLFARVDAGLAAMVAGEPSAEFAAKVMACVAGKAEQDLLAAIDSGVAHSVEGEPSAQFAAAVRQRIAAEPAVHRAWFSGTWWAPALAVAAIVLVVLVWNRGARIEPPTVQPRATATATPDSSASLPKMAGSATIPVAAQTKGQRRDAEVAEVRGDQSPPSEALPAVMIPADERVAVLGFYRFVQEGRINTAQVLESNRIELAKKLEEMRTPLLVARAAEVKTLDLVDTARSTADVAEPAGPVRRQ